jgi:seryl-tRNA synthetase
MLDIKLIRSNANFVKERLALRGDDYDDQIDRIRELDENHRAAMTKSESLKATMNARSKEIGMLRGQGNIAEAEAAGDEVRKLKGEFESLDSEAAIDEDELNELLSKLPNLPHESVPAGGEDANVVLRTVGEKKSFTFAPKPHWEIAENLGLIDFARGAKLTGSGFVLYKGDGALLERGLIQFMLDIHVTEHG